jgi:RNA polymerase sigma factor (sigma-70 family)
MCCRGITPVATGNYTGVVSDASLDILLGHHRAFLRYLERKIGDPALAEDILQDAFVKLASRPDQAPPDEALVPWFYRTLRNAAIDRFRRRAASDRAIEAFAREMDTFEAPAPEMEATICACVSGLAGTLKPEYTEVLMAVDMHGQSVKSFAEQHGLTSSNAGVRLFRAREALKQRVTACCGTCAEHGCNDCTCRALSLTGGLMERDVVCGMQVDPAKAAATSEYNGKTYYFCAKACKNKFDAEPQKYAK